MESTNIFWQTTHITDEDRCRLMGQKGITVWFTGLSGAGKSTIANAVDRLLYERGIKTCVLDGDNLRHGINAGLGFSDADRYENIRRVAEVAKLFNNVGIVVLASLISPFAAARESAKSIINQEKFIEVYVKADLDVCMDRDPKGLYKKAILQFTGKDSVYESPENPDVIVETEYMPAKEAAILVADRIYERLGI